MQLPVLAGRSREVRFQLKVSETQVNAMTRNIALEAAKVAHPVEWAMAEMFQGCVLANFGPTGAFRPWSGWPPLSKAYAKKVGRTYATLEVTGRLKSNVMIDGDGDHVKVVADDALVPYSTVHQYGGGNNIPQREYFPMYDDGNVTRQVQDLCLEEAKKVIMAHFN